MGWGPRWLGPTDKGTGMTVREEEYFCTELFFKFHLRDQDPTEPYGPTWNLRDY